MSLQADAEAEQAYDCLREAFESNEHTAGVSASVSPPFLRHYDLWFSDGSVVLRAERTLYRVHMSQLSRHSAFFRDMFSLPQPAHKPDRSPSVRSVSLLKLKDIDREWNIEGCPVVHLQDTAEDITNLLIALYDGPTFGHNDRQDYNVTSGILRLATKYIIDSLRLKALNHLSTAWPSTLKGWDAREEKARSYEQRSGKSRGHFYPSPIAVINLAREVNASCLLQSAFYDLSRYEFYQIFEPNSTDPLFPPESNITRFQLTSDDTQKLAIGKEASNRFISSLIQSLPATPSQSSSGHRRRLSNNNSPGTRKLVCSTPAACRQDFAELASLATQHYVLDRENGSADPLYVADEIGQLKSAEVDTEECAACARNLEVWASKEREKIWRLIPGWFRLDSV